MISATLLRSAAAEVLGVDVDRCETASLNKDYSCPEVTGPCAVKLTAERRTFKIYECPREEHAAMVRLLSAILPAQEIPLPECYGVFGHLVVAQWAEGTRLSVAAYHVRLHRARLPPSVKGGAMPQVRAFFEGVLLFARRAGVSTVAIRDFERRMLTGRPAEAPFGVLHSDFSPRNLIVTTQGSIVSVDNEFLSLGYGREWDILNTVNSMRYKAAWQSRYLDAYAVHGSLYTLLSARAYWETMYHVRMAGIRLSEWQLNEARSHLRCAMAQQW